MLLTNEQRKARHKAILDAIYQLNKEGQEQFFVREIARKTGILPTTLYAHPLIKAEVEKRKAHREEIQKVLLTRPYQSLSRLSNLSQREPIDPSNRNYKAILDLGYQIDITVSGGNQASLHLVKEGRRVHKVSFKPNGKTTSVLKAYLPYAKYYTSADMALVDALDYLKSI